MDARVVTNAQLTAFVQATDYRTLAERPPDPAQTTLEGREREPVVHVAFEDAAAYADGVGKELPTEAEWEFAARGGLEGAVFCWGEFSGRYLANTWQDQFPVHNLGADGFIVRAPVGSFPPNGYGLCDMAGNVWDWTTDWYSAPARRRSGLTVLHTSQPARRHRGAELQSGPARCSHPA